ncbi:MAG: HD domain-containing protein [Pseudomonadales bacterium]|nr:HD domain-containing protein [Pseudomonadales bacterium]NRA15365.1 HD domain-containing protein [Oceanospirillaceae bacterium]
MQKLDSQLAFIFEIDRLKAIYRRTMVKSDNNRQENSAEHSWHIALTAQVLQEYAEDEVDINKVVSMLLIHDIVEIDAGDLFAFDDPQLFAAQEQKEIQAAERIFGLLPQPQSQQFLQLWLEFESAETTDARFAKAMDRILPLVQNMANQGGSWAINKVTRQQVLQRNIYLQGLAPKLWEYVNQQLDQACEKGWLIDN